MKNVITVFIVLVAFASEWSAFNYYHEQRQDHKVIKYIKQSHEFILKADSAKNANNPVEALRLLDSADKYSYLADEALDMKNEFK